MKICLIIFIFFCSWVQVVAQDKLVITYQEFGGPPTNPPLGTRTTEFVFKKKGDKFIAKNYTFFDDTFKDSKKKTIRFEKKKTISKSKTDSILNPKTPIYFKDLGFTIDEIKDIANNEQVIILSQTLDLLKPDFVLNFDSAYTCREQQFVIIRTGSCCGGATSEIFYKKNQLFYHPTFYTQKNFDIKMYLKVYSLIKDFDVLQESSLKHHYGKKEALYWFIRFLEMFQCEDYYASLFMKENPEYNTSYFKRTKKGWNFEEYLKKIKSNTKN